MSLPNEFKRAFHFTFKGKEKDGLDLENAKKLGQSLFSSVNAINFSESELKNIYYQKIWLEHNLNQINNEKVSHKVFDFCCNINPKRGTILLQRSLNSVCDERIIVNGSISSEEIELINDIDNRGESDILEKLLCHYAANFFELFGKKENAGHTLRWIFR